MVNKSKDSKVDWFEKIEEGIVGGNERVMNESSLCLYFLYSMLEPSSEGKVLFFLHRDRGKSPFFFLKAGL